ncbi:MAG: hypothetical protein M5R37_10145 [Melioribacteraceae bacterium]|nr:hypothetical protein [Melioribacteraceae bacterium]
MDYKIRLILYVISKAFIYASIIGLVHALVMLFVEQSNLKYWLTRMALFVLITFAAAILFIIRKGKIPAAGKDYH